jgi:hypothetical protein
MNPTKKPYLRKEHQFGVPEPGAKISKSMLMIMVGLNSTEMWCGVPEWIYNRTYTYLISIPR